VLLLLTISGDGTSDRIVERLGSSVFRYNFDQLSHYKLSFGVDGFEIVNPKGHSITSDIATSVFWWKAFSASEADVDKFFIAEGKYLFLELYSWFQSRGMAKGNSIRFHDNFGKIATLSKAKSYFSIPKTVYSYGLLGENIVPKHNRITKSLSSELTSSGKVLFTTDVSSKGLDPRYPWFLQEKINSRLDVTCFLVKGRIFAFSRDRRSLKGLDWRAEQTFDPNVEEWFPYALAPPEQASLLSLSSELGVDWGRYDFMLNDNGDLVFLEFNANGQFVFLDYWDKHGVMDAVIEYLRA
jgi:hypothetical protein